MRVPRNTPASVAATLQVAVPQGGVSVHLSVLVGSDVRTSLELSALIVFTAFPSDYPACERVEFLQIKITFCVCIKLTFLYKRSDKNGMYCTEDKMSLVNKSANRTSKTSLSEFIKITCVDPLRQNLALNSSENTQIQPW